MYHKSLGRVHRHQPCLNYAPGVSIHTGQMPANFITHEYRHKYIENIKKLDFSKGNMRPPLYVTPPPTDGYGGSFHWLWPRVEASLASHTGKHCVEITSMNRTRANFLLFRRGANQLSLCRLFPNPLLYSESVGRTSVLPQRLIPSLFIIGLSMISNGARTKLYSFFY